MKTRVAIIGCGMIADQHADQLRYLKGCELVAACDSDELMGLQLAERFRIPRVYTDAAEMLRAGGIDAVHITTPAQSHFSLGRMCLDAGCHVYLEKPFTVNSTEAEELLEMASNARLRVTVGHNLQFSPETLRFRQVVNEGFLGGPPVHVECIQCYSHDDPTYGKAVLADPTHWVRRLPGSLLQNLISHGVSKVAEFLDGNSPEILSFGFSSPYLVQHNCSDILDEVRVVLRDERGTTAFFLFTTQFGAASQELRLFGRAGTLVLDNTYRTVLRIRPSQHKSYLRYFLAPLTQAREQARNTLVSLRQFARKEFQMDYGMRKLMELFYTAIREGGPDPIPSAEILRTARIMDTIFDQVTARQAPTSIRLVDGIRGNDRLRS
ncbi:Gfo/Idh/MocA family protein [Paludibaculum fermentans]|uniref:Gfo/Idh/MocA family protein n=1 Tax=Paludibaculum fermentans TaxID=1473598 RepID=UPI003EBD28A9